MKRPAIIPQPAGIEMTGGIFTLSAQTKIHTRGGDDRISGICQYLKRELELRHRLILPLATSDSDPAGGLLLEISPEADGSDDEGYELTVAGDGVIIRSASPAGLFYGAQTFIQLLPPAAPLNLPLQISTMKVSDRPRFRWRGMHLDVARHFFPPKEIKKYLDLLALHKLNVFHWHLSDDQGWRLEIRRHPRLTEVGAWRNTESGSVYGGYYTQDEVRDIIRYASERFITIVPEIDMPGHAGAALAAYPEYSCTGQPLSVKTTWGIFEDVFCPGKEATFAFLEEVLQEVLDLFPGPFIHLGGDECPTVHWIKCPDCQKRIALENLARAEDLHGYFVRRMGGYILAQGRRFIGWDEIADSSLPRAAAVMSWRGLEPGFRAAREDHDAVMSPTSQCYFDYYQAKGDEPKAIGGFLPLEKVYRFDPAPLYLEPEAAGHILGGQGNIWTEYMSCLSQVEYMALPRLCALAESLWSSRESRNLRGFKTRLQSHLKRLRLLGYRYRDPVKK